MLLHVEMKLFGLAGEHSGHLEEVVEELDLEVLAGLAPALLRGRFGARGAFTGGVDGRPDVLDRFGQGDDSGGKIRHSNARRKGTCKIRSDLKDS